MMALTDLLKNVVRAATLTAALYSCGGEEKQGCSTDYDCREPRVCVRGYCEDRNGGGKNNNEACGSSPLVGNYLWLVSDCQGGSVSHFNEKCYGEINLIDGSARTFTYNGLTLTSTPDSSEQVTLELRRTISRADLPAKNEPCAGHDSKFDSNACALANNINLYFAIENGRLCLETNLVEIKSEPWLGQKRCAETIVQESWHQDCFQ